MCVCVWWCSKALLQQCDSAQSRWRNAESSRRRRRRRVPTPLLLPQPKAGMYREQVETPSAPGHWDPPTIHTNHAYHPPQRIPFRRLLSWQRRTLWTFMRVHCLHADEAEYSKHKVRTNLSKHFRSRRRALAVCFCLNEARCIDFSIAAVAQFNKTQSSQY